MFIAYDGNCFSYFEGGKSPSPLIREACLGVTRQTAGGTAKYRATDSKLWLRTRNDTYTCQHTMARLLQLSMTISGCLLHYRGW
jgi:hypothetical protein